MEVVGPEVIQGGYVVRVSMRPKREIYVFSEEDIEYYIRNEILEKNISEKQKKKKEKWIWEFLGELPKRNNEYYLSINEIEKYLKKLEKMKLKPRTMIKRVRQLKNFLHHFDPSIKEFDDIIDRKLEELSKTINAETRLKGVTVYKDHVTEFLRRLERLYEERKVTEYTYQKAVAFVLLGVSTGRRVEEISGMKVEWLNLEEGYIILPLKYTKEGKILGVKDGYKRIPLTEETVAWLKFFLKKYGKFIQEKRDGYLFSSPERKAGNPIFLHKLTKKFKKELKFDIGGAQFEIKYLRKFFSQEWERRGGNLYVKFELMGHSPRNINYLHYTRLGWKEINEEYRRVYYNLSVLTPDQRKLIAKYLSRKKRKRKKGK
ncbi:hypothetical protein OCC_04265 [Thermococcus litoralis DSM 5473]|uniref:Tyr recombinase domain-containing protein n=1 Tax=Thermococcus litoralis (strain ATCC 51850 / DSM 5473 / JCM 8560 / NS-C) TaxID=523849 RepID=H3ZPJ8_THELN|nr:tyrosine-type recombinase/integrase [Thermococcus litoralis]EHR78042.1 hypothetical protein OCC_04265 [Thermococcus litoralis DSM 5473]